MALSIEFCTSIAYCGQAARSKAMHYVIMCDRSNVVWWSRKHLSGLRCWVRMRVMRIEIIVDNSWVRDENKKNNNNTW